MQSFCQVKDITYFTALVAYLEPNNKALIYYNANSNVYRKVMAREDTLCYIHENIAVQYTGEVYSKKLDMVARLCPHYVYRWDLNYTQNRPIGGSPEELYNANFIKLLEFPVVATYLNNDNVITGLPFIGNERCFYIDI